MIRLYEIPYSTNVERVTIAAALKGVGLEHVVIEDRTQVRELSGQDLVPVIEDGGRVIADSMVILAHLEEIAPDPPLGLARPDVAVACDWFNRVWKVAPNKIAETGEAGPWARDMERHAAWIEGLISVDGVSGFDVVAFPFLKYAVLRPVPDDLDPFHAVLAEYLEPTPRLEEWIERMDALGRA